MAEEEMNKINFSINDGDAFYANEMSITFGPAQFAFDFKNISPRVDMRNQDGSKTFVLKHNVIIIEPFQIKQFAKVLNDAIARYEVEYGAIEMPNAIKKAETDLKKLQKQQVNPKGHDVPSYLG
jgi:uncharacterized protein YajQ (UPF0234 family)